VWIYATERHKSGRWHAHVLAAGAGPISWDVALAIWQARNGRTDIQRISDPLSAIRYLSKTAALEGEVVFSDTILRYRMLVAAVPVSVSQG